MLTRDFLSAQFANATTYDAYLAQMTPEQQRRWKQVHERADINSEQRSLIGSFIRQMNVLVVSAAWCGDCVQQVPLLARIASANATRIHLRFLERDAHQDLADMLRLNDGDRIPVAVFMAEDFHFCALAGDRTLSRYRKMAQSQLGASCPTGIIPPGQEEVTLVMQDWLNEFERVQLMLRLSSRLRQKYGD